MRLVGLLILGVVVSSCDASRLMRAQRSGIGSSCAISDECLLPLVCEASTSLCAPSRVFAVGEACVVSLDCLPDLYCATGVCAAAGTAPLGALCLSTADCLSGLRCSFGALAGECAQAGQAYRDQACVSSDECLAGLVCDPVMAKCVTWWGPPQGLSCRVDSDCTAEVSGYVCDPATYSCVGRGPDGAPVASWSLGCADGEVLEGGFRVRFDANASGDFFALPYPNDARLSGGRLSLARFPLPPTEAVPSPVAQRFASAAGRVDGFGPSETVFLRFSGPPKFCSRCTTGDAACFASCMGRGETGRSIYVVDITHTSSGFVDNPFGAAAFTWAATTGNEQYICGPHLAVAPLASHSWQVGHTYFVFVHKRVDGRDVDGSYVHQVREPSFVMALSEIPPDNPADLVVWSAYAPLRVWLNSAPVYPSDDAEAGEIVNGNDIGGGAVFTVRDPTRTLVAIKSAVGTGPVASVSAIEVCAVAGVECSDPTQEPFAEVHGVVGLPQYQQGTAPYELVGGDIVLDATGAPVPQVSAAVRFALTVPLGTAPASGWPMVIYAHGVGGDYRSHAVGGLAEALTAVSLGSTTVGFAVLGFDGVAHGQRRGSSTWDAERLFLNFENPDAMRGNALQQAADILVLRRALYGLRAALVASNMAIDPDRVFFVGDGPGATSGALAMAVESEISVVVLASMGASAFDGWLSRTSPFAGASYLRSVLADAALSSTREQPMTSLMQGYLDDIDAAHIAPFLASGGLAGGTAKHVLQIVVTLNGYAPETTQMTAARLLGLAFVDDAAVVSTNISDDVVTPPQKANVDGYTRIASVHEADNEQAAMVLESTALALARVAEFLASAVIDAESVPSVAR